ncbi:MAG TPA: hypothetical protein VLG09_00620 [Candidatus Saccharimonadales bacterium]|nr:hypothetical protein [Candidatus Saccharimonadales bacterium]
MSKRRERPQIATLSREALEHVAENMKERIYATITLLAVIAALWQNADHHTVWGSIATIVGTAAALWMATLIAARMSYRAVHGKSMQAHEYSRILFSSSGLFAPVIVPSLLVGLSSTGLISLKSALMTSMVVLSLSLFLFSFTAGRKIYDSTARLLLISALEMLLGVGVIALKLAIGE